MRGVVRGIAVAVVVAAAAWSGLWWYTQNWLQNLLLDAATTKTASDGSSSFDYDSISTGTNPLVASATMQNVRWNSTGGGSGVPVSMGAAQVELWISPLNPLVMHIGLPNRLYMSTPRVTATINFGSIAFTTSLNPHALLNRALYPLTSENLAIQNMDVLVGNSDLLRLHVDRIAMQEKINPEAAAQQTALDGQSSIDGIALSPALVLLGHVPFGGKIAHIGFSMTGSGPVDWNAQMAQLRAAQPSQQERQKMLIGVAHKWAQGGGHGKANLTLVLGPSTLVANGTIGFYGDAQPQGTADVTANHLDALSAALTNAYPELAQGINNAQTVLSPYLSTTDAGGQTLTMHVAYGKDGVLVNGTRKADMPPLNWDNMANLAAAPVPQAPGDGSGAASSTP